MNRIITFSKQGFQMINYTTKEKLTILVILTAIMEVDSIILLAEAIMLIKSCNFEYAR